MSAHTPGPWHLWGSEQPNQVIAAANGPLVAQTLVGNDGANARLIAAAPELLEALEEARDGLRWYQERNPGQADGSDNEAMARIDAAIAKATRGAA